MEKGISMVEKPMINGDLIRHANGMHMSTVSGGVYETSKKEIEPDAVTQNPSNTGRPWARWGSDNNYPQRLIDAVMADPAASLLEKRRAMHWGSGLMFHRRIVEKKKLIIEPVLDEELPAEIDDFFYLNDFQNFTQGIIADFEWWHDYTVEYITANNGKILEVKWHRRKDVRSELRDKKNGKVQAFYLSGDWPNPNMENYARVNAFDKYNAKSASGIYRHQLVSVDKDYNPQPAWHGITRWLHIAGKIPRWILANIDNSINIKYHVEIPLKYFLDRHPLERYKDVNEQLLAIQKDEIETYKKMDELLTGETNVSKTFYTKIAVDESGKPLPSWKINVLANDVKDSAWLTAYGTAAMAITSGLGLSPSIGGQILPNGLGSGSGSDLREQFNFYMQVMTAQPRQTTLEPFEIIKRRNGWPKDLHLGYRDIVLQSVDQSKGGFEKQSEPAPTSGDGDSKKTQP
ncbi:MAG TPA: hypothetical protein VK658_14865 [Chryseolinea sp.]|nr:hypothetical protein [Chryseolinea sp.]